MKPFKWTRCTRPSGTQFLKLIYYSESARGVIEAGRFNLSKQDAVQNEWTLEEIIKELNVK